MDQDRHTIDKLYLDTATLAWNGNPVDGIVPIKVKIEFCMGDMFWKQQKIPL